MSDLIFRLDSLPEALEFIQAYDKVQQQVPGAHGINLVGSNAVANIHDGSDAENVWKVIVVTDSPKTLMALSAYLHAEMPEEFFGSVSDITGVSEPTENTEEHAEILVSDEVVHSEEEDEEDPDEDDPEGDEEEATNVLTVGPDGATVRKKRPPVHAIRGKHSGISIEKTD